MTRGRLIVLSGPDGVGKDHHAARLVQRLTEVQQRPVRLTGLPTHCLDTAGLDWRATALAYALDRRVHAARVIEPALARGDLVVCVRYALDGIVYSLARAEQEGEPTDPQAEQARRRHLWELEGLDGEREALPRPSLTLVLTAQDEALDERIARRGESASVADRNQDLQRRVRRWFSEASSFCPWWWPVTSVDTTGDRKVAAEQVWERVTEVLAGG